MGAGRGCFGRALDGESRRSIWGNVAAGEGVGAPARRLRELGSAHRSLIVGEMPTLACRAPGVLAHGRNPMLNRTAIILRYREPFVRWINEADPYVLDPAITIDSDEQSVYLIHQIEHRDELDEWIALNHEPLFESELEGWYTDEALWPKNRTLELFNKWVHVEYHTVVIDVVDAPLLDDEAP